MSMNFFLVYSSCGQPQKESDSLLNAKGKYIWIWLAGKIFKVNSKYQCRCTRWLLQLLSIIQQRTGVHMCPEEGMEEKWVRTKAFLLYQREWAMLKKIKPVSQTISQQSSSIASGDTWSRHTWGASSSTSDLQSHPSSRDKGSFGSAERKMVDGFWRDKASLTDYFLCFSRETAID